MKITQIRTFVCHAYRTNWVFVKVVTDQPGLYGIGEATLEHREQTVVQACHELERDAVGRDPRLIESLWHDGYRDAYWRGGPVLMSAISAVDMALWDIAGKDLGVPVYRLLGGQVLVFERIGFQVEEHRPVVAVARDQFVAAVPHHAPGVQPAEHVLAVRGGPALQ